MSDVLSDEGSELVYLRCLSWCPKLWDTVAPPPEAFTTSHHMAAFAALVEARRHARTDRPLASGAILEAAAAVGVSIDLTQLDQLKSGTVRVEDGEWAGRRIARLLEARRLRSGAIAAAELARGERVDAAREKLTETAFGGMTDDDAVMDFRDLMIAGVESWQAIHAAARDPSVAAKYVRLRLADAMDAVYGAGPGDLCVVAASTGVGKSSAAMTSAMRLAQAGTSVGIVSVEDWGDDFAGKAAGALSRRSVGALWHGTASKELWQDVQDAVAQNIHLPLSFVRVKSGTIAGVRMAMARMVRGRGAKVIFVDYLQAISAPEFRGQTRERIDFVLSEIIATAAVLGVPVVLLSQLSRFEKGSPFREPHLSDLKESGTIENRSQCVVMMWITTDTEADKDFGRVHCKVAKVKRAARGTRWAMKRGPGAILEADDSWSPDAPTMDRGFDGV